MHIATKTVTSLLLVTTVAVALPGISQLGRKRRNESQFDRLLQRHDRKGELRAEILGLEPPTFRDMLKKNTFEEIIHKRGFANIRAFRLALLGKLRNELKQRGWTSRRIERYTLSRRDRVS
jgi:hypothetical protein